MIREGLTTRIKKAKWIVLLVPFVTVVLLIACKKREAPAIPNNNASSAFIKGADIGWLTQMESAGYLFYNSNGTQEDCISILKSKGINAVRLRIWVNPANGWCGTKDVLAKAIRAQNQGMEIMLDFHYSDVWADPGHQTKPVAWSNLSLDSLEKTVYAYTYHIMDTLRQNGIIPVWAQTGNETNNGLLWNDGLASASMKNFATLINNGYNAIKAVDPDTKVIVHISNGFDNGLFRWVFDSLKANGAHWDIIGMSLYPATTSWAATDSACLVNMNDMVSRYGCEVMVCEIGMAYNDPTDSKAFITDIINKTKSVTGGKGLGVFYWEPECYNWQGYTLGAFDNTGKPTAAMDAFTN